MFCIQTVQQQQFHSKWNIHQKGGKQHKVLAVGVWHNVCTIIIIIISCLLWFCTLQCSCSPSQVLFFLSLLAPHPTPTAFKKQTNINPKTHNQALKGHNVDQNLQAQKLPSTVCEYALLCILCRNVHDCLTFLLLDILKTEALLWDDLKITYCYLEVLKHARTCAHTFMHAHTHLPVKFKLNIICSM